MAKAPETVTKVEPKAEEPKNSALDARKKAAEAARIKTQSKLSVQPAKVTE